MEGVINIAGAQPRIGTTTQAIQLIYFLQKAGYKAAYVEMNSQDYIWATSNVYSGCKKDREPGKIIYADIDLYSSIRFNELVKGGYGYDYLICDYGNMTASGFDMEAFCKCSANIIVCGTKPNEIFYAEQALKNEKLKKSIFSFSFVREEDKADVKAMMRDRAPLTVFAPYLPDVFDSRGTKEEAFFYGIMNNVVDIINGKI